MKPMIILEFNYFLRKGMSINLGILRKTHNTTRVQIAKDLGVDVRTIIRWEQNEVATMALKNVKKLAEYFNKILDEFFGE